MAFDVAAARKAGYSDDEIAEYLGQQSKFDTKAARASGYSDSDIIGHLSSAPPAAKPAAEQNHIYEAWDRLKGDVKTAYASVPGSDERPAPGSQGLFGPKTMAPATARKLEAADRIGSDILDLPASVVRQFVNKPLSKATGIPEDVIGVGEMAGMMALGNRGATQAEAAAGGRAAVRPSSAPPPQVVQRPPVAPRPPSPVARAVAPIAARFSPKAAERQAADRIASRATDLPAVRASLAQGADELVPGSTPTTFQQTGDLGLGSLEREVATSRPAEFAQHRGEQNAARVSALEGIQAGADPNDVAKALRGHFDELDTQTQAEIDAATQTAQQRGQAVGGHDTPESYGERTRGAITAAENAAREREGALWRAVDPDGTLTGNVTQTRTAAQGIQAKLPKTARPMQGEEAAIFSTATEMPALAPVGDLIALRSRVSTEMRNELITNGRSPSYSRLSQLRGEIQDNLSTSIAHQVAIDDAAVARGMLPAEEAISAKINAWRDEHYARKNAVAGGNPEGNPVGYAGGGARPVRGSDRAAGEAGGGAGRPEGDPGVPDSQPGPTFDDAALERLGAATEATKTRAETFGLRPVSQVTATEGAQGRFRLPNGQVPARFFHPGQGGFDHMQAALRASPDALPVLEDYAAMSLRRAAVGEDGVMNPAKFARWRDSHQDALRALPEATQARFADAASAASAVADAGTARDVALSNARQGALGRVMGLSEPQDVTRTVGSILGGRTAVADMKALWTATGKDAHARAGLRQAVADHILNKFIGNTEAAASGVSQIKADGFQTFVRQNRAALADGFSPDELQRMQAIAADIQRAKRSEQAVRMPGNSNTAQDLLAASNGAPSKGARSLLNTLAGAVGLTGGGWATAIPAALGADLIQGLRAAGIERVDQLVTRAMLDPKVAKSLLDSRPPPKAPRIQGRVEPTELDQQGAALLRALGVTEAASTATKDTRQLLQRHGAHVTGDGAFGPRLAGLEDNWPGAVETLQHMQNGEAIGALSHPELQAPIDVPWGAPPSAPGKSDGYGLAKIMDKHPEVVANLPQLLSQMRVTHRDAQKVRLESADHLAAVRLDWDRKAKTWLVTAFEKKGSANPKPVVR